MRRILETTVALGLSVVLCAPTAAFAATPQEGATINGTAENAAGEALPSYTVQLRDVSTGQLVGTTTSNAAGNFTFPSLNPGTYVVEVVSPGGSIVGTSAALNLAANATLSVGVMASAVAALSGAAAATAPVAGGAVGPSLALTVTTLAAAGGVTALVVSQSKGEASPSR